MFKKINPYNIPDRSLSATQLDEQFPFKHWLYTLLLAPIPALFYEYSNQQTGTDRFAKAAALYFLIVLTSFLFSLPTLAVYLLVFKLICRKPYSPAIFKTIFNSIAVLGIVTTLLLLGGSAAFSLGI